MAMGYIYGLDSITCGELTKKLVSVICNGHADKEINESLIRGYNGLLQEDNKP